eukprot:1428966-Pleurochrysis_carterae.AAC.1
MPTHARGSTRVFERASRGFPAYARQPKGKIGIILGLLPVNASYEDIKNLCGGPVVRLSTSTAYRTVYVQNEDGARLASKLDRASSMMERIAISATPFNW